MKNKTRVIVRIAGRDYPISGWDEEQYVRRVAQYVDRKINELTIATRLPIQDSAVLTAVTIADDLIKTRDEVTRLQVQLEETRALLVKNKQEKEDCQ